ncbi:phage portal protein [Clostridium botulinum]|nr:phage portal protein [Clostridium botulinum]NFK66136.1 phage portal protein [Clostridium botulinum]NFK69196.1 phage portal protein [Clostridium botulinum]NFK97545.1 phage portal protein [Clostridium botulinum]
MLTESEIKIIKNCYLDYKSSYDHYDEINAYYYGNTDTLKNFKPMNGRSNLKVNTNFNQKLTDEEAQYSFGNSIKYTYKDDNDQASKDIKYHFKNNDADHDINLGIELIKNGLGYELSYLDEDLEFKNEIITPLEGYPYFDRGKLKYFLHIYSNQFDEKIYIDVYTNKMIYHLNSNFEEIKEPKLHPFGIVPVGVGKVGGKIYTKKRGYEEGDKTIHRTIKTLQDAYETNLSDMVSEISDFRNAILKLYGIETEDETDSDGNVILDDNGNPKQKQPVIRGNAVLFLGDKKVEDAEWLIKNINDVFIKNTRDDVKDLIYTLTSHIDSNEKMVSNLSGIALRSRLQNLEAKCSMNEKAMTNIIRTRLKCLFQYLWTIKGVKYDSKLVHIEYTPKVPVDEATIAQIISQLPEGIVSKETFRSWIPRITDPIVEGEKVKKEQQEDLKNELDLDKVVGANE